MTENYKIQFLNYKSWENSFWLQTYTLKQPQLVNKFYNNSNFLKVKINV